MKTNITQLTEADILINERNQILPKIVKRNIDIEYLMTKDENEKVEAVASFAPDGTPQSFTKITIAKAIENKMKEIAKFQEQIDAIDRLRRKTMKA